MLLVVSVGLLVSGVQAQPTTIIAANEAVATLANTTWKSNADFLHEVRQIPEITKVIAEAELVKLCSVEQHFNHIDETLASWKPRRISRPAMNLRLTIPPTVI